VTYYPCNLIAPTSAAQAHIHPVGCGPFAFVKWNRNELTELKRFEHYFETDAKGNSLPYLDGIIGRPKKEDRSRLTSLRSKDVDLIDTMSYADAAIFPKKYAGKFQTWEAPSVGTAYVMFNLHRGPFADKRVRQAAAHAIDHRAIAEVVFFGRGETATGFYAPASPWYIGGVTSYPGYDPDKAKSLLRQAKAVGTQVVLQALVTYPYLRQTGEVLQAMWEEVGFKVLYHVDGDAVLRERRRDRSFHAEVSGASYRFDPDGWFSRMFLSTSPTNQVHTGFRHEKMDRLITEARQTADRAKRLDLYTAIESMVNEELPLLYLHHVTLLEAGSLHLKGYEPGISGAFSSQGAGIRTAWFA
jgi:peptide/nickel transport system substrate-binding protein